MASSMSGLVVDARVLLKAATYTISAPRDCNNIDTTTEINWTYHSKIQRNLHQVAKVPSV